jgi:methylglutaconyl-CoA hydratase
MAYRYLVSRRDGPVEHLTINRPEVRNALNDEAIAELAAWAEHARDDRTLRAVVLRGAGDVFSAGADVNWMARAVNYTREQNADDAMTTSAMFAAIDSLPVPVIGRIQGAALGGGAGLAAVCDIVVADQQAVFGFTEVRLGILPALIAPFVLAKIGDSAARELFLTGARFSAARAAAIGLVHAVVPAGDLDATIDGYLKEILLASPDAVAAAKRLIRAIAGRPLDEVQSLTVEAISAQRVSPQGQEGLRAFLEKRKPGWAG